MPKKRRRPGATETIGVSLDIETKRALTVEAVRQAAFERAWRWYGGAEPDDTKRAKLDAEFEEGWKLARKHAATSSSRPTWATWRS